MTTQKTSQPYIGSMISLISKLDIRYEGILYTVNSAESTIALAKVRSFGTEDRPTGHPVPARDDIYEYIIFKAADIKDLVVCESTKPSISQASGIASDPAIVSFSNQSFMNYSKASQPDPASASSRPNVYGSAAPARRTFDGLRSDNRNQVNGRDFPREFRPNQSNGYVPRPAANNLGRGLDSDEFHGSGYGAQRMKFESDYDFESANLQFKEALNSIGGSLKTVMGENDEDRISELGRNNFVQLQTADGQETTRKSEIFYDKNKSFFDSISSETMEKNNSMMRSNWMTERQTNQETFGHQAVRSLAYRRGGRGWRGVSSRGFGMSSDRRGGGISFVPDRYRYTINRDANADV